MRYVVMIRRTRTGYSVDVPDLPGCVATGNNVEHARQMIAEAIEMHLDLMYEQGETIPQPATTIAFAVEQCRGVLYVGRSGSARYGGGIVPVTWPQTSAIVI